MFALLAQVSALTPDQMSDFGKALLGAFAGKQWWMVGSLGLVGLVWTVRKYLSPKVPFLASASGGALLTLLTALGGALVASLASGGALTWPMFTAAALIAFKAAGGWALLMHLADPLLTKWGLHFDAAAVQTQAKVEGAAAAAATPSVDPASVVNGDGK